MDSRQSAKPRRSQISPQAGVYRKSALATLVAAKVSKQKIAIFLSPFIVRPSCLVYALSLDGVAIA
jgi:hypothetical protein